MRCPFCQTLSREDAPECVHCGFSLPKLDHFLGTPPAVQAGLTDDENLLGKADRKRLLVAIERFSRRFPQVRFNLWLGHVKKETPMHLHVFWLFNRSSLCSQLQKGAVNREVLLGVDTLNRRASLMIGYGLEPFVGGQHLHVVLDAAKVEFAAAEWRKGSQTVIERLADTLLTVHAQMRQTYGADAVDLGIAGESNREF